MRCSKNGLELGDEERMKRLPRGFEARHRSGPRRSRSQPAFRRAHAIDPAGIHSPGLVDELVDFTLRAKPLLDWGRAIEGRTVAN